MNLARVKQNNKCEVTKTHYFVSNRNKKREQKVVKLLSSTTTTIITSFCSKAKLSTYLKVFARYSVI